MNDDLLRTGDARIVIPNDAELKRDILDEAHKNKYIIHPGNTKMWPNRHGLKCDITEYVAQCHVCQQVKAEHQRAKGLLQPLSISEWKWD